MKLKLALFFCGWFYLTTLVAQDANTLVQKGVDLNVMYRNEADFFIGANTEGFDIGYRRAKHLNGFRKAVWEFEGLNKKAEKQTAITNANPSYQSPKSYNFGEINDLYIFRIGYGFQQVKFRKAERKSVEIRYSLYGGLSLGFLKPVYLEIIPPATNVPIIVAYNPNDPVQIQDNIYGGAPFLDGFNKMSIVPGGYCKFAISFEYGDNRPDIKAIEVGTTVDAFPIVMPQMAFSKNYQVFPSLYVDFVFGKKWF